MASAIKWMASAEPRPRLLLAFAFPPDLLFATMRWRPRKGNGRVRVSGLAAGGPTGYIRGGRLAAGERLANPVRSGRKQP